MSDSEERPIHRLIEVMDQLRSPGGCPWDAEQTHQSLSRYLLEETYEALEAMDQGDVVALREELGDLLLQVVFHARIAQEEDPTFTLDSVAQGVIDKLIRRHPHVFAGVSLETQAELEASWAQVKLAEKGRESITDGVPQAMPALQLATQLLYRSREIDVHAVSTDSIAAVNSLLPEVTDESIAELLTAVVEVARQADIDAESALRSRMGTYRAQVRRAEGLTN